MNIKLITDSSADLPQEIIDKYNIRIVPLGIIFQDGEYYDKFDITPKQFFEKLTQSKEIPKTSQVTPAQFIEAFTEELKSADKIICVTIGAKASGTYQSALIAKEEVGADDIMLIDSESLCVGTGLVAIKVAEMIESGMEIQDIVDKANQLKKKVEVVFCVDTLEYLRKGGRIKPTQAIIGDILGIKPILTVDEGVTETINKARGRNKVLKYFIEHIKSNISDAQNNYIVVAHGQDMEYADKLMNKIKNELNWNKGFLVSEVGATIGTHSGPGVLAAIYIKD